MKVFSGIMSLTNTKSENLRIICLYVSLRIYCLVKITELLFSIWDSYSEALKSERKRLRFSLYFNVENVCIRH